MIIVLNQLVSPDILLQHYSPNNIENKMVEILSSSNKTYSYAAWHQLVFELNLRSSIIQAARDLHKSSFAFQTFRKSKCNPDYWNRTEEGGFQLKDGVKASQAVKDIYINSKKYGTECATAMVIVYFKALMQVLPEELFNEMFSDIYLMNWSSLDRDLGIVNYKDVVDYLPGDCRYFKNPDVDPLTPEWQGENVIDLGDGTYYGHGIGIETGESIIQELNKQRKAEPTESAYLMDFVTHPGFKYLADRNHRYSILT